METGICVASASYY